MDLDLSVLPPPEEVLYRKGRLGTTASLSYIRAKRLASRGAAGECLMRILVTGAAGFIGSHLVGRLLECGDSVVGLDDFNDYYDPARKRANVAPYLEHAGFELVEADIRDGARVNQVLGAAPTDVVVHLAARAGVRPSIQQPLLYQSVNVEGTAILLDSIQRHGVRRLVFASSSSVYGEQDQAPFREDLPADRPISPYAATKRAGELLIHTACHLTGLEALCLRLFTVYGPRQRPDMAIHKFTRLIWQGAPVPFFGDGSSRRDYTYVDDIVEGFLAAIRTPKIGYEVLNLGASFTTSLAELVTLLGEALDREPVLDRQPMPPGDVPLTCADVTRAGAVLGYQPRTPPREGIRTFVQWFLTTVGNR